MNDLIVTLCVVIGMVGLAVFILLIILLAPLAVTMGEDLADRYNEKRRKEKYDD